jgi:hypothetical protein
LINSSERRIQQCPGIWIFKDEKCGYYFLPVNQYSSAGPERGYSIPAGYSRSFSQKMITGLEIIGEDLNRIPESILQQKQLT